jgi:hypothetical protein
VSSQPPTRYENYPPEPGLPAEGLEDPAPHSGSVVRAYAPPTITASAGAPVGRRAVVGLVLAVPIAGILWLSVIGDDGPFTSTAVPGDAPSSDSTASTPKQLMVGGRYAVTVADGWDYTPDGDGGLEFTKGANTLSASVVDVPPSTLAIDDIAALVKRHNKGFTGKIDRPVDRSTDHLQRASMSGTGKFRGRAAKLLAELWIDDTGSGLLVTRVLTARAGSTIAVQAQTMTDELSTNF